MILNALSLAAFSSKLEMKEIFKIQESFMEKI